MKKGRLACGEPALLLDGAPNLSAAERIHEGRIRTRRRERGRRRRSGEVQVVDHVERIGDVDPSVVVDVSRVEASGLDSRGVQVDGDEDRVGGIDQPVPVRVAADEVRSARGQEQLEQGVRLSVRREQDVAEVLETDHGVVGVHRLTHGDERDEEGRRERAHRKELLGLGRGARALGSSRSQVVAVRGDQVRGRVGQAFGDLEAGGQRRNADPLQRADGGVHRVDRHELVLGPASRIVDEDVVVSDGIVGDSEQVGARGGEGAQVCPGVGIEPGDGGEARSSDQDQVPGRVVGDPAEVADPEVDGVQEIQVVVVHMDRAARRRVVRSVEHVQVRVEPESVDRVARELGVVHERTGSDLHQSAAARFLAPDDRADRVGGLGAQGRIDIGEGGGITRESRGENVRASGDLEGVVGAGQPGSVVDPAEGDFAVHVGTGGELGGGQERLRRGVHPVDLGLGRHVQLGEVRRSHGTEHVTGNRGQAHFESGEVAGKIDPDHATGAEVEDVPVGELEEAGAPVDHEVERASVDLIAGIGDRDLRQGLSCDRVELDQCVVVHIPGPQGSGEGIPGQADQAGARIGGDQGDARAHGDSRLGHLLDRHLRGVHHEEGVGGGSVGESPAHRGERRRGGRREGDRRAIGMIQRPHEFHERGEGIEVELTDLPRALVDDVDPVVRRVVRDVVRPARGTRSTVGHDLVDALANHRAGVRDRDYQGGEYQGGVAPASGSHRSVLLLSADPSSGSVIDSARSTVPCPGFVVRRKAATTCRPDRRFFLELDKHRVFRSRRSHCHGKGTVEPPAANR